MVQSITHIAEYICVPYLKSILECSLEFGTHIAEYICVPYLKSILDALQSIGI